MKLGGGGVGGWLVTFGRSLLIVHSGTFLCSRASKDGVENKLLAPHVHQSRRSQSTRRGKNLNRVSEFKERRFKHGNVQRSC